MKTNDVGTYILFSIHVSTSQISVSIPSSREKKSVRLNISRSQMHPRQMTDGPWQSPPFHAQLMNVKNTCRTSIRMQNAKWKLSQPFGSVIIWSLSIIMDFSYEANIVEYYSLSPVSSDSPIDFQSRTFYLHYWRLETLI